MLGGREVIPEAAPGIRQEPVSILTSGAHRIEVHVITSRPQITVAAAFDQLPLVSTAQNMADELVRWLRRMV